MNGSAEKHAEVVEDQVLFIICKGQISQCLVRVGVGPSAGPWFFDPWMIKGQKGNCKVVR